MKSWEQIYSPDFVGMRDSYFSCKSMVSCVAVDECCKGLSLSQNDWMPIIRDAGCRSAFHKMKRA